MDPFILLNVQTTFSLVVFALLGAWYIAPSLFKLPLRNALIPLLFVHVFRYTPLTLFAPGQVDANLPVEAARSIAYGDLLSAILALIAILLLRYRLAGAIFVVWLFNIVGIGDIILALVTGVNAQLYSYELGFNWYILNFYVPALIVTHVIMLVRLRRGESTS